MARDTAELFAQVIPVIFLALTVEIRTVTKTLEKLQNLPNSQWPITIQYLVLYGTLCTISILKTIEIYCLNTYSENEQPWILLAVATGLAPLGLLPSLDFFISLIKNDSTQGLLNRLGYAQYIIVVIPPVLLTGGIFLVSR